MNKYITYSWKFYTYSKKASCKCSKCGKTITTTFSTSYREDSSPNIQEVDNTIQKWQQEKHICNKCKIEATKQDYRDITCEFENKFKQVQDLQQQIKELELQQWNLIKSIDIKGKVLKYKDNEYVIQYFDCCANPRIVAAPINKREPWYERMDCRDWAYIDIDEEYTITDEMFENRYKKIKEMEEENGN